MSIVFFKKFSTNFFSVAYMERACAHTGTIYTRKKNFWCEPAKRTRCAIISKAYDTMLCSIEDYIA